MCKKSLVFMLVLLAALFMWTAPAAVMAEQGAITLPGDDTDHTGGDPGGGLSADPQTFDVDVWNTPTIVEVPQDSRTGRAAGFWNRFLAAFEDMMQRLWEIASPR